MGPPPRLPIPGRSPSALCNGLTLLALALRMGGQVHLLARAAENPASPPALKLLLLLENHFWLAGCRRMICGRLFGSNGAFFNRA